jgi:hypothetical protein
MAHGSKCYCCGANKPIQAHCYYCQMCLLKLSKIFKIKDDGIINKANHSTHCGSCGQWKNRRIIMTGNTTYFNCHQGDGIPICENCVNEEINLLKKTNNSI